MDRFQCDFEVKFDSGAPAGTIEGYGAVFGNIDSHGDVILKGAFRETIRESKKTGRWPAMLLQHGGFFSSDDQMPVGVWTAMEEDDTGLKMQGQMAVATTRGKDAYELLKMEPRPALNGLSIGYRAKEFALGTKPTEPRRTLKKVELFEVSLVTFPSNDLARVSGVKAEGHDVRKLEAALRDAGLSRSEAKAVLAGGFKAIALRDAAAGTPELVALLKRAAGVFQHGA